MISLIDSLKRPFSDLERSGLLFLLSVPPVSFLAFPWVSGYLFATMRHIIRSKPGLPQWSGFWSLLKDGVLVLLSLLVLAFPGYALFVISSTGIAAVKDPALVYLASICGYLLLAICSISLPSLLLRVAKEDDWGSAFRVMDIVRQIFHLDYILAWAVSLALSFVTTFLSISLIGVYGLTWSGLAVSSVLLGLITAFTGLFSSSLLAQSVAQAASRSRR